MVDQGKNRDTVTPPGRTPILEQMKAINAMYPGVLLLFRHGDTFSAYGPDSYRMAEAAKQKNGIDRIDGKIVARFDIVGREGAEELIAILIASGERVAICEPVGTEY